LFADQLGDHFLGPGGGGGSADGDDGEQPVLLVESRAVFRRRRFHRAKAHLVLSALRHRAAELGERATLVRAETYRAALAQVPGPIEVVHPTSRAALRFVRTLGDRVRVLPPRGFASTFADFRGWAESRGGRRLLLEEFYRAARLRTGLLTDDSGAPLGGKWNYDTDNREPPPKGAARLDLPEPLWPAEDDIDEQVRADLDAWQGDGVQFAGRDGPRRFAATGGEARAALADFVAHRLPLFGRYEDAMLAGDPWMAHSLLSVPMNLGLLHPLDAAAAVARAHRDGDAPLAAAEGFIRQVIGWRDYVWHLYWHFPDDYRGRNALDARTPLPQWWADLDAEAVDAACLSSALAKTRDHGWAHHIERLMVLGSWALQRGYDPGDLTEWFRCSFVAGYDWVMVPNVVGMSQHADGGLMATKPYTSGGAYLNRMGDHCAGCRYRPEVRLGERACPFTAGYWAFLHRAADDLRGNHRMKQPLAGLHRLKDLDDVLAQEARRGADPP
jgi:deoxyribodipyrimidine photolyase-related protein